MRRTHLRGHRNILKRLLIHVAAFNLSLILRREIGVGTPRGLQDLRNHLFFCFYAVWMVLESCSESHHHPQELSPVQWTVLPSLGVSNETQLEKSPFHHGLLGPDHPNVAVMLGNYAVLLRKMDRDAEAKKMEARAEAIRARHAGENQ